MALVWVAQLRPRNLAIVEPARTALVGALAVLYAALAEQGAPGRRVAIASMMGSWGVQLAVYMWYGRVRGRPEHHELAALRNRHSDRERSWSFAICQRQALASAFLSLPALLSVVNPTPEFSPIEYAAAGLWLAGFSGQATAERRQLAPPSDAVPDEPPPPPPPSRARRAPDRLFESIIWIAFALFASASPWGWLAATPAAVAIVKARVLSPAPRVLTTSL